ncbi:hypothetical protein J2Y69_002082 [Microbacterium resistens]|uniref:Uncharacterized protein n=1 Tax=Microbacterium resistens TaxID=156977 RepID=A0ABU1SD13_9MICO|nr:hypothetical protein [Microbacterium resistens]MDR6867479.1 hypothetical protein [Microbacterium resistens]
MTSQPTDRPLLSRRGFLGATLAAGVILVADPSPVTATAAAGDVTLSAGGISILASVGGRIAIRDADGVTRSQGSRFQVKDTAAGIQVTTGGTPSLVTLPDGTAAIRMDYALPPALGSTTVFGLFTVSTNRAHLEWHVSGPSTLVPDGFLFSRAIASPTEADRFVPVTEWVRDAGGGIPYEDTAGIAHVSTWGPLHGMYLLERSRQAWTNSTWIHSPGVQQADGSYRSTADFFFSATRPSATAAIGMSRALGLEIWTDKDFNIWGGAGETISVAALVANGGSSARSVTLSWWVRDYDGAMLATDSTTVTVPANGTTEHTFSMPSPAEGIALAEVSAVAGADEAFARTTLAVLAPQTYTAGGGSMFGIANYPWLQVPSAAALLDLWQRVGIERVRIAYDGGPGLPPSAFDARGMHHNIELQPSLDASAADAATWAANATTTAVAAGAEYFEVGNELNRPFNTGLAAQAYIDKALRPVVDYAATLPAAPKILNNGLAGMDRPWVENFIAAGGWDLIDGFAYHPGRGNVTPDHIPTTGGGDAGPTGDYWNFLGGLRQLKELMAVHGEKEIWLTEAYACTRPNGWWNDTSRHAAENVFLTLALAKAEGVRNVCWYQFHDSVLGQPQVADPENVEYHYGLMNRDVSAKPSLLAYATAAKVFDQASFLGWAAFDDPQNRGLLFDTPDGPAAVLWNRADGYVLNADHDPSGWWFAAPEVWIDPWPTKTSLTVPVLGASAHQVDAIGRTTALTVTGSSVTITLDGAPRVFYGLSLDAVG